MWLDVFRETARQRGLTGRDYEEALDAYIRAGTMRDDDLRAITALDSKQERLTWMVKRFGVDALRMAVIAYDSMGLIRVDEDGDPYGRLLTVHDQ